MMIALLAAHAAEWPAVAVRAENDLHTVRADALDLVEVLDVNDTHAALRVIHRVEDPEGMMEAVSCDYAGMQKYPKSGVKLAIFDLKTGQPEEFEVYAPAFEPDQCLSHEASKKALDAAKARAAAVGLDVTKKPAPVAGNAVKRAFGEGVFTATEKRETHEDDMLGTLTWTVELAGHPLYRSTRSYTRIMAGSAEMKPLQVWAAPGGYVALEHTVFFNGRSGTTHAFDFTPLLQVP